MLGQVLVLAHCGANWVYCDGGSAATAVALLVGTIWAGKRAERKAKAKKAERLHAYQQVEALGVMDTLHAIAAEQRTSENGAAQPAPARKGTRKKQR